MKTYKNIFEKMVSVESLLNAWDEFKKGGKRKKRDVQAFEFRLEDNLFRLHRDLKNKRYKHGQYVGFYVRDPKVRHIHKAEVRDRVVHHALFKYINPIFEPTFIADSYSARIGKGTHKGVERLSIFAQKVFQTHGRCFILKCDIRKFFPTIDHELLLAIINRRIKDPNTMWLIKIILGSFSSEFSGKGLMHNNKIVCIADVIFYLERRFPSFVDFAYFVHYTTCTGQKRPRLSNNSKILCIMLRNIVLDQKSEKERLLALSYIPRTKEPFAKKWLDSKLIKVVMGPRRAGKSVFSLMLLKDRPFMYFNFDDEMLSSMGNNIDTDELMRELHAAYGQVKTILFDEIQNLPKWELFANRLHRIGYNLVLTGSSAHLLSKELAAHLTGRHMPIEILPFDFNEFLQAKKFVIHPKYGSLPERRGELLNLMENYMINGGFPEIVVSNVDPKDYLKVLFDSLLFKDVVKRHRVRFSSQVSNLGSHLVSNFAGTYTVRKLLKALNLNSASTTEKYITYMEEAYLLFSLLRYSPKSVQRIKSPKKVYVVDNGFVGAKAIQHSPDKGKLMENLVFTELVKRGVKPNHELFYYKTRNDREIDFVLKKGYQVTELIQASYESTSRDVEEREVKALMEAGEELSVTKLTVLTWNEKREVERDGKTVQFLPLWEWLLRTAN